MGRGTAEEGREARASCLEGQDGIFPGGHGVQGEGEAAAHQQRGLRHLLLPCFCHGPLGGGDGHCEECWELNNANDGRRGWSSDNSLQPARQTGLHVSGCHVQCGKSTVDAMSTVDTMCQQIHLLTYSCV